MSQNIKKLIGGKVLLNFPSVGATENLLMAAVLAEGKTAAISKFSVAPTLGKS